MKRESMFNVRNIFTENQAKYHNELKTMKSDIVLKMYQTMEDDNSPMDGIDPRGMSKECSKVSTPCTNFNHIDSHMRDAINMVEEMESNYIISCLMRNGKLSSSLAVKEIMSKMLKVLKVYRPSIDSFVIYNHKKINTSHWNVVIIVHEDDPILFKMISRSMEYTVSSVGIVRPTIINVSEYNKCDYSSPSRFRYKSYEHELYINIKDFVDDIIVEGK